MKIVNHLDFKIVDDGRLSSLDLRNSKRAYQLHEAPADAGHESTISAP